MITLSVHDRRVNVHCWRRSVARLSNSRSDATVLGINPSATFLLVQRNALCARLLSGTSSRWGQKRTVHGNSVLSERSDGGISVLRRGAPREASHCVWWSSTTWSCSSRWSGFLREIQFGSLCLRRYTIFIELLLLGVDRCCMGYRGWSWSSGPHDRSSFQR